MNYEDLLKAQLKYADKIGAKYSAVIGDDEIARGSVNVKNMMTGEMKGNVICI